MNKQLVSLFGIFAGFSLLVLAAFSGAKFLDLPSGGGFGLGFVGLIISLVSLDKIGK